MVSIKAEMEEQLLPGDVLVPKENGFTLNGRLKKAGAFTFTLTDGGVMKNLDIKELVFHPGSKIKVENGVLTLTSKDGKKSWDFENAMLKISKPKEGGTPVAGGAVKPAAAIPRGAWKAGSPKPKAGAGGDGWKSATKHGKRSGAAAGGGGSGFTPKEYELEVAEDGKYWIDLHYEGKLRFVGVDTTYGDEDEANFYANVVDEKGPKFKRFYFTKDTMDRFCEDVLGVKVPEGTFPFYVPSEHYIEFLTIRQ